MIHRIDVVARSSANGQGDPLGHAIAHQIAEFGLDVGNVSTRRVFLFDSEMSPEDLRQVATQLLGDPIVETAEVVDDHTPQNNCQQRIEIHLKPGVMDPVAESTRLAIADLGLKVREVRTGRAYLIDSKVDRAQLEGIASRVLANGVIESVHFDAYLPARFAAGHTYEFKLRHVPIRQLDDEALKVLSRQGHLFLSLAEMKAVQGYFRLQKREPTDIELETIAQTWSEHCVHKTLKSAVDVTVFDETGRAVGTRQYKNLIKETIFSSTMALMQTRASSPFCLSVFADNAGVVAFDETEAVCFKVETHNHPSAIEPYGGSATGVGGVIRDILGTGLSARPIANTDIFCVAYPDGKAQENLPRGVIHPRRTLRQIVAGVRDYGNRMGIPTVNGAVYFDDHYLGNPLVFCGCVGLIPRNKIDKAARPGDAIVVMGGRTGRDGIHGATFSSAELTDTHADEFSHAVQIGNAITEKKVADVILAARDLSLFTAITDCGAGGLSSAIGEMGADIGAFVELHRVPLKYQGLRYDEIWISEAQERMVLSVPREHVHTLLKMSAEENVEASVIGEFGTPDRELVLNYDGAEVGRMEMNFIHNGVPMPTRRASVVDRKSLPAAVDTSLSLPQTRDKLLATLAEPNIASKHWIIRQYDHEVQGGSVIKPLVGPLQIGPSDAAVIRPKLGSYKGVALGCGLAPEVSDPYHMAIAAIDEAIRNVICVGAHPDNVAILDNFCWPSVDDEETMGTLVRACEACRDAALAFGTPFISGKDSLHNQFTNQETREVLRIPNTLLISAMGVIDDVRRCITMDLKRPGSAILHIAPKDSLDLTKLAASHRQVADLIGNTTGVLACHDVSDGGLAVAVAEMCIASGKGAYLDAPSLCHESAFARQLGQYVVEVDAGIDLQFITQSLYHCHVKPIGCTAREPSLVLTGGGAERFAIGLAELTRAWRGTLDW